MTGTEPDERALVSGLGRVAERAGPLRTPDRERVVAEAARLGRRRRAATALAASVAVVAVAGGVAAVASSSGGDAGPASTASGPTRVAPTGDPITPDEVAALDPTRQGVVLGPLREAADAAARVGGHRGDGPLGGVYTNVALGPDDYRYVTVYLTDLARSGEFLARMTQTGVSFDPAIVRFAQGAHNFADCQAAVDRAVRAPKDRGFQVNSGGASTDCTELRIGVTGDPAAARAYFDDPANGNPGPGFTVKVEVSEVTPLMSGATPGRTP